MERVAVEYLANALWQVAALALGARVLLRMWRPGPAAQHRVWLAVLGLGLLLPLRGGVQINQASGLQVAPAVMTYAGVELPTAITIPAVSLTRGATDSASEPDGLVLSPPSNGSWLGFFEQSFAGLAAAATSLHRVSVSAVTARWIAGLWLAIALWGLLRLVMAWRVARRLVAGSREIDLGEREATALRECSRRMGVRPPEVRESDQIAGPVVVGWSAPVLLWPEEFARCSSDELRAVLCHELAHVRRRDYGMNLLCEAAAVPLKWHPAARGVERRIRATREMACDAMAAQKMESETVYAECLVRLARKILGGGMAAEAISGSAAVGLFNGNVMEERVMRLMRGKTAMSLRARLVRGAVGAAAMMAAIGVAGMFHVVPAMAQVSAPAVSQVATVMPVTPVLPVDKALPVTPVLSVAPVLPVAAVTPVAPVMPVAAVMPVTPILPVEKVMPVVAVLPVVPVPAQVAAPVTPKPVPVTPVVPPRPVVKLDGQIRDLTPAERARVEKQLRDARKQIAEATAKMNSAEFKRQMADAQKQIAEATAKMNSAEFRDQMAEARAQIAEAKAKMNSPEFKKQMADAQKQIAEAKIWMNSPEFKKEMSNAQRQIAKAKVQMNSPEFKKQMADAQKQVAEAMAQMNSPEFKKQMADAQKQVAEAMAKMKADQEKDAGK